MLAARSGDREQSDVHIQNAWDRVNGGEVKETPYRRFGNEYRYPLGSGNSRGRVKRASKVVVADPERPEPVGHHWLDVAWAFLLDGNRGKAIEAPNSARAADPINIRRHPQFRETLLALADQNRRTTASLPEPADWAGVDL
jgi:hypothetical protein